MDNTNRNKTNLVLYIVLALIVVTVVCMTVFSVVTNTKKHTDIPKVTEAPKITEKNPEQTPTRPVETQEPEDTRVELPDEDVDANPDDEPSEEVSSQVKLVFTKPVEGYLLKGYDIDMPVYSLTMNDYRVHTGLDILAEPGAPVMAVAEGTVEYIYSDPMMGNCISVSHANGLVSYYMGLSEEVGEGIAEGAPVYCGQVLSSVGDSTLIEIAEESHLHLEMKQNGSFVDPSQYISYQPVSSDGSNAQNYED